MLAGDLGKANLPAIIGPKSIAIRFPAAYNRQYETCSESSRQQKIQDALRRITGESWTVRLELSVDGRSESKEVPASILAPGKSPVTVTDPMIEAIQSSLDARVMRVDDGFGQAVGSENRDDDSNWANTDEE
jgi:hypothetical protein